VSVYLDVPVDEHEPHIQAALAELRRLIVTRWPDATFSVYYGDDPEGIYLKAVVDVPDLDEVVDRVLDRMVELSELGLPVYVVPEWPPERIRAYLRDHKSEPIEQRLPAILP